LYELAGVLIETCASGGGNRNQHDKYKLQLSLYLALRDDWYRFSFLSLSISKPIQTKLKSMQTRKDERFIINLIQSLACTSELTHLVFMIKTEQIRFLPVEQTNRNMLDIEMRDFYLLQNCVDIYDSKQTDQEFNLLLVFFFLHNSLVRLSYSRK